MHDFLMPMNDYLASIRPSYDHKLNVTLFAGSDVPAALIYGKPSLLKKDDFLGDFKGIAEKFLNISVNYEYGRQFSNMRRFKLHAVRAYSFGPYFPQTFDNLMARAESIYDLDSLKKPQRVILIERSHKPISANRSGGQWIKTGSLIRYIENHQELMTALSRRYGDDFINVVLEDMPFDEQIALFRNARIVIGQHGAGMCNIAWMANRSASVLELPTTRFPTFEHMCLAKQLDYRVIYRKWRKEAPASCLVDIGQVMGILDSIDSRFTACNNP